MRNYKVIACIADIHLGNKNIEMPVMKAMLKNNFLDPLSKLAVLDAIIVAGDISTSVLSLNSEHGQLYLWFFNQLYKIGLNNGVSIIVVEGTKSHDQDHLSAIDHLCDNDEEVDFRIFRNYESTYLFEDYRMLVLPDKRVNSKMKPKLEALLNDKYDIIIGHGMIDTIDFPAQESEHLNAEAYRFPVKQMMDNCTGPIFFGHIHTHTNIGNKFYYCGSFTKLERCAGEHGFLICAISNRDHTSFKVEHYINKDSIDYHNIKITEEEIEKYDGIEIVEAVRRFIADSGANDLFTLRVRIQDDTYINDKIMMIDDAFRSNRRVSVVKKVHNKKEEESTATIKEKKTRLAYIFDDSLSLEDVFVRYYEEEIRYKNPKYKDIALTHEDVSDILWSSN